jgi:hypothetical protein
MLGITGTGAFKGHNARFALEQVKSLLWLGDDMTTGSTSSSVFALLRK